MESVNICLSCGYVASMNAKFCSGCGSALTLISSNSGGTEEIDFSSLVADDNQSEWSNLYTGLNAAITEKTMTFLNSGWNVAIEHMEVRPGVVFLVEVEDDPWSVSVELPSGSVSEAWAGCYLKISETLDNGQKFLVSTSQNFLRVAPTGVLITYAVIPCPRCEAIFLQSSEDEDAEFEREDAITDCVACNGSGEWVLGN